MSVPEVLESGRTGLLDVPAVRSTGEVVVPSVLPRSAVAMRQLRDTRTTRLRRQWRAALTGPIKPDWETVVRCQAGAHSSMKRRKD